MTAAKKRWIGSIVRWAVAVVGVTYVLWNIRFHDRVRLLRPDAGYAVEEVRVWDDAAEDAASFVVGDDRRTVPAAALWTQPDRPSVSTPDPARPTQSKKWKLVAVRPAGRVPGPAAELLVEDPDTKTRQVIDPAIVYGGGPAVLHPLVERGVNRMVREANWGYLAAAVLVLPLVHLITSYRWYALLNAQDIRLSLGRTFVLNMVGAFYNSFMPGSTGGDVAKAYYASKHTEHRTRAVLTVLVDRIIGLLALLVLGGAMAAAQWDVPECRRVAVGAGVILACTAAGLVVFYQPTLRRATGLDWLLKRLPMQAQVHKAVEAMDAYGRRPGVMLWTFACSFPVHVTTIVSATLAGLAFHLPLAPLYYWVVIPVTALAGAIPISPQGAGVMEVFAVQLTKHHGVTAAQAVALMMCVRLTAMFWNLVAGLFVLKGGYHAPTDAEQHEMDADEPAEFTTEARRHGGQPAV
ncbi:MAG: hypothetical protein JWO31_2709 [Phycisphaerales bacterium]|nr:hypothetical protein [Phycisphaerales bacterium]